MAEMTQKTHSDIDHTLERSLAAWNELPQVAEEIGDWDEVEQADFVYEWPIQEAKLLRLRGYTREDALDADQAQRYRELESTVEENRPIIEDLQKRYIG